MQKVLETSYRSSTGAGTDQALEHPATPAELPITLAAEGTKHRDGLQGSSLRTQVSVNGSAEVFDLVSGDAALVEAVSKI